MNERVAVIGTGIAGMSAAYYLRDRFDVVLYEKNDYIGGHTNTVFVGSREGKSLPIDSGFMVFNDKTYPNLLRLFAELGVGSYDTSMSFSVSNLDSGLEYACSGLNSFFAQRRKALSPRHWGLLAGIKRFFAAAHRFLEQDPDATMTLSQFAGAHGIRPQVMSDFVVPMAAAIWSTPPSGIERYPARALLTFLRNHQLLGIGIQLQWKTVKGGSESYKRKLLARLPRAPQANRGVSRIEQGESGVRVIDQRGLSSTFDYVVLATHADQALATLANPTPLQQTLLRPFRYNRNPVALHSDATVMPKAKAAWASWNFQHSRQADGNVKSSTHYWMNNLQRIDDPRPFFVSVDHDGFIDPRKTHWTFEYEHPRFDAEAIRAQSRLPELNREGRVLFCGSYFRYGFHEDALWSALQAVSELVQRKETRRHELMPL